MDAKVAKSYALSFASLYKIIRYIMDILMVYCHSKGICDISVQYHCTVRFIVQRPNNFNQLATGVVFFQNSPEAIVPDDHTLSWSRRTYGRTPYIVVYFIFSIKTEAASINSKNNFGPSVVDTYLMGKHHILLWHAWFALLLLPILTSDGGQLQMPTQPVSTPPLYLTTPP